MKIDIILENLSGHAKSGNIGDVLYSEGDTVKEGDVLFQIETGKGVTDITSPGSGVIEKISIKPGEEVSVGQVLGLLEGEKNKTSEKEKSGQEFSYSFGPAKPVDREMECEIAIIGGGPGGYVAALQAAKMGASVILIEKEKLGGTCLNVGCIPTKTMIRSSELFKDIKSAESFGLSASHSPIDISKIVNRKNNVVKQLVQGIGYLLEKNKVTVLNGTGILEKNNSVKVKEKLYNTTVKAGKIIIATGSSSCLLPVPGMDSDNVLTSTEALSLSELPKKMAIIGGGIIGMEFAFLFSNLGVEITVFEYFDSILSVFDKDIISTITESAKISSIKIVTGAKVKSVLENESGGCIIQYESLNKDKYDLFEKVLVSVGREPCYEGLGLEENGISLTENKKGVLVDDTMKTSSDSVYAIGDITNKIQLAHVASHQGITAVKNIMGEVCKMDYSTVPSAVFTSPEFATVGISEKEAAEKNIKIKKGVFPFSANGKALTLGKSEGFVKLIEDLSTGKLIGGAVVGPHATDIIGEIALAVKNGLKTTDLAETIHAHPTTAESVHEAALALGLGSIHF